MAKGKTHKKFFLFLSAVGISVFGSMLSSFAMPLIVYSMYNSGIILSMFEMISVVIGIAFAIPFGFWLRNKNLKHFWILFLAILGISGIVVFLWFNIFTLIYYNIICLILFIGIGIIYQSLVPSLVSKDEIVWANTTIHLTIVVTGVVAPFVGGFILTYSWRLPFLIDAITFFIEIGFVMFIPVTLTSLPAPGVKEKISKVFKTSLRYITSNRVIKYTLILEMLILLIGGGVKILNIAYFSYAPDPYILYGTASTISALAMGVILLLITLKVLTIKNPYRTVIFSLLLYSSFFIGIIALWHSPFAIFVFLLFGLGNFYPTIKHVFAKHE